MRRRIFTTVSAASLVLCTAAVAVWISTFRAERLLNSPKVHVSLYRSGLTVDVDHGKVRYGYDPEGWDRWSMDVYALPNGSGSNDSVWGFNLQHAHYPNEGTRIGLPYWLLAGIFAVLPFRWMAIYRREKHRAMIGRCRSCGYDLTGNVSGTCPECGAAVVRPAPASPPSP